VGRACISHPENNGEVLAEHVWVTDVPHWLLYKCNAGEQVEFSAVVKGYVDRDGNKNFCLTNADELTFLHCGTATPPAVPDEGDVPLMEQSHDSPPEVMGAEPVGDPLERIRRVKHFVKEFGGFENAERIALAVQNVAIPLPQLIAWIGALRTE
jgi:hypothetical protein